MDHTGLGGQRRELDRRLGRGEVDHRVGLGEGRQGIVGDGHAQSGAAHRGAGILADPVMAGPFQRGDQAAFVGGGDGLKQHPAHPAGRAGNDDAGDAVCGGLPLSPPVAWQGVGERD